MIRNIIFDWSGTLADDFPPVLQATNEVFARYGKPPMSADEFRQKFFLPFPEFYKIHLPEATLVQLDHYYHTSFKFLQEAIPLLPGAREILQWCRGQDMKIFLLSTIHAEHFEVQGARLGVKDAFTRAYTQAIDKRHTILQLLAEHDLDPGQTLFVGDMVHDIETARHGGVTSCAVLTGYDPFDKLKAAAPDLVFRNLLGLLAWLQEHARLPDVPPPIPTVGALISGPGRRLLMVRTYKWSHLWGIPGGKIHGGETAFDALHREIREETALALHDVRFVLVQDCIRNPEFFKPAHFLLLNYTARAESLDVRLNEEADEFQWVSAEDAARLPLNTPTRILLDAASQQGFPG